MASRVDGFASAVPWAVLPEQWLGSPDDYWTGRRCKKFPHRDKHPRPNTVAARSTHAANRTVLWVHENRAQKE
jgi:hypothetical protein